MIRRRRSAAVCAVVALAGIACSSRTDGSGAPTETQSTYGLHDLTWLAANVKTLRAIAPQANDDFADLQSLKAMIGNARIVALGEQSHGTHEFQTTKHRLIRFLVQEMGFNTFAMETQWAEANRMNDYVLGGAGDPLVLQSNQYFWTWNTQEMQDQIAWMRAHNANPGGTPRVSFLGFDMQYPRVAMNDVDAFLADVDPAAQTIERSQYACFRAFQDNIGAAFPSYAGHTECKAGVDSVRALLATNQTRYVAARGRTGFDRAFQASRVVQENEDTRTNAAYYNAGRAAYMAENVGWLLDQAGPGAKIILWAHNGHINATIDMGSYLRKRYGADYVPVGFAVDSGLYNSFNQSNPVVPGSVRPVVAAPLGIDSYEYQFARVGPTNFYFDLRPTKSFAPTDPSAWIGQRQKFGYYTETYNGPSSIYSTNETLPNDYDVLFFIHTSTPTLLMPFVYSR